LRILRKVYNYRYINVINMSVKFLYRCRGFEESFSNKCLSLNTNGKRRQFKDLFDLNAYSNTFVVGDLHGDVKALWNVMVEVTKLVVPSKGLQELIVPLLDCPDASQDSVDMFDIANIKPLWNPTNDNSERKKLVLFNGDIIDPSRDEEDDASERFGPCGRPNSEETILEMIYHMMTDDTWTKYADVILILGNHELLNISDTMRQPCTMYAPHERRTFEEPNEGISNVECRGGEFRCNKNRQDFVGYHIQRMMSNKTCVAMAGLVNVDECIVVCHGGLHNIWQQRSLQHAKNAYKFLNEKNKSPKEILDVDVIEYTNSFFHNYIQYSLEDVTLEEKVHLRNFDKDEPLRCLTPTWCRPGIRHVDYSGSIRIPWGLKLIGHIHAHQVQDDGAKCVHNNMRIEQNSGFFTDKTTCFIDVGMSEVFVRFKDTKQYSYQAIQLQHECANKECGIRYDLLKYQPEIP